MGLIIHCVKRIIHLRNCSHLGQLDPCLQRFRVKVGSNIVMVGLLELITENQIDGYTSIKRQIKGQF